MNHLDLCSGIGGFALAASWVWEDHTPVFVEIDPYCQKVLRKHWPDAEIHSDVKTYDARPLRGRIDLCTGGYPCQPFSMAGKRGGEADDRHLWPNIRRIVGESRPRWCLFENVAGHITLGLDRVLSDLEGLGYSLQAAVIPACAVDAPHRRDRVWIVAHSESGGYGGYGGISGNDREREGCSIIRRELWNTPEHGSPNVADAGSQRREEWDATACRPEPGQRTGRIDEGWRPWLPESGFCRVADGVPRRVDRLRALGNSIVPQVAAEIMRAIKMADER